GGAPLTCTRGTLPVAVEVVTVTAQLPGQAGTVRIDGELSTSTRDLDSTTNTTRVFQTVTTESNLNVSIVDSPIPVGVGETLTYTLGVRNYGPAVAQLVNVTDTLPPEVTFVSASGAGWTCA